MKRTPLRAAALTLAACLFAAGSARAGDIKWSYTWNVLTPPGGTLSQGKSSIMLSDELGVGGLGVRSENNTVVQATNFTTLSTATTPDVFNKTNASYVLKMTVTDKQSGDVGYFFISGYLTGQLATGSATGAGGVGSFKNTFTSALLQSQQIGGHLYTLDFRSSAFNPTPFSGVPTPVADPSLLGTENKGALAGYVTVNDSTNHNAPEPASLALACFGLSGCGLAAWRRRRQA